MRVAVLTHHGVPNFGANLQAVCTFRLLESLGHEPVVLDYTPAGLTEKYQERWGVREEQIEQHRHFVRSQVRLSPALCDTAALRAFCGDTRCEAILSGSDVVFRMNRTMSEDEGAFPNPYWLDWCQDLPSRPRRASLAASCGGSEYYRLPWSLQKEMAAVLRRFDFLSVRDRWTQWMVTYISRGALRPACCPDPVSVAPLVLPPPTPAPAAPSDYILLSVEHRLLSDAWVREFRLLVNAHGYRLIGLPVPESEMPYALDAVLPLPLSPLAWYRWIAQARGFVGTKFHPIACSLFNGVPFVSIDLYQRAGIKGRWTFLRVPFVSKTYDLCRQAGALPRLFAADRLHRLTPSLAWHLLHAGLPTPTRQFAQSAATVFTSTCRQALGLGH